MGLPLLSLQPVKWKNTLSIRFRSQTLTNAFKRCLNEFQYAKQGEQISAVIRKSTKHFLYIIQKKGKKTESENRRQSNKVKDNKARNKVIVKTK